MSQLQIHLDLIWQELENQRGVGGKTVRILGPIDMRGLPIQNTTPSVPTKHVESHQNGGNDELTVTGLHGLLGDPQTTFLMGPGQRGGAKLGDVFSLVSEVLTLSLCPGLGIQKKDGTELGLKQQFPIVAIEAADASDLATAITLVNELKTKFDDLLVKLKAAEVMSDMMGYFNRYYFHQDYFADTPTPYFLKVV